jgi:trk system potassium uptake protein TrkH
VLLALGLSMEACALAGWGMGDPRAAVDALQVSALASMAAGLALWLGNRNSTELSRREGFGVVAFGWIAASISGAVPYVLSGVIPGWMAAVFETMSGFTTTGASVIAIIEEVPRGILLWRSLTHFYGGMGVLVLVVAILPLVGTGGMQLFRAEMPGPTKDRLTPRIAGTAKRLWAVYVLLVVVEAVLLRLGGMAWFDAWCHAFATVATGGFSTRTASVGDFGSLYIELVILVFMVASGVNFALHYRTLRGQPGFCRRDSEFKFYLVVLAAGSALITGSLLASGSARTLGVALRDATFASASIMTTTGFTTADFNRWPGFARLVLFLLMFVGGCAGSTGGSIKVVRILLTLRALGREIRRWMRPQAVMSVKVGHVAVDAEMIMNVVTFVLTYLAIFAAATVLMTLHFGNDWISAASSVAATLGNVGPGFNAVGPMANYATIPPVGQGLLTVLMLLGRLELYTVLVLFIPSFWRR